MIYVVAQDGSGDYASIQQAVNEVPEAGREPVIILVRCGEYRERVIVNRDHLRIVGEERDRTVITWSGCAKDLDAEGREKGTFLSYTVLVTGVDVEMENLTIRNDAGDGREVGQAVALYAAGDRGTYRNCQLTAHQDTLFCGPTMPKVQKDALPLIVPEGVPSVGDCPMVNGREYFEDCRIQGDVDFIFGPYRCWFERCTLVMGERGGFYTAANTPRAARYGLVFHACRLTGECGDGMGVLGRPWRAYARTLFLDCEMDRKVAPEGFQDWDEKRVITWRCGEWHTRGERQDQSTRHPSQWRLTDEEAARITVDSVIGGPDGWHPDRRVPTWFMCGDSTMADYPGSQWPMTGWGQALRDLVKGAYVNNCAVCGRSTKSFISEKRLGYIELCLRKGDRMLIQFSHNDEKPDVERATDPYTTYREYLGMFIYAARRHGAEPVLLTPVVRRHFDDEGHLKKTHGQYPEAMKCVALERGVQLIDMEAKTGKIVSDMGDEPSRKLYCQVPAGHVNYPDGVEDNTHLSVAGAVRYALAALEEL